MRAALRSYGLLLRWNVVQMRTTLPMLMFLQTLIGVGIVIGFSYLVPQNDAETALYLSTGALTIGLITVGIVAVPQVVMNQKFTGALEHHRTLPVPRLAILAADATVWVGLALPGLAAALGVAALRFDLAFRLSPLLPVTVLLVATCTVAIGYGIAYAARPEVSAALSQLILFVTLMFAPINYPADRLPDWLASTHESPGLTGARVPASGQT
jgi:ABC-2 type transport system permease protein